MKHLMEHLDLDWINNKLPIHGKELITPCNVLMYCPYGQLVEMYPLPKNRGRMSCKVFGHNCPAYYQAEPVTEDKDVLLEDEQKFVTGMYRKFYKIKENDKEKTELERLLKAEELRITQGIEEE